MRPRYARARLPKASSSSFSPSTGIHRFAARRSSLIPASPPRPPLAPVRARASYRCDTLGIILRPAGAYALLAQPLSIVTEITVDARDLLGSDVEELFDRCAAARPIAARFALIVAWLTERFSRAKAPDPAIAWMAAEIERGGSDVARRRDRKATGLSRERLIARFRDRSAAAEALWPPRPLRAVLDQLRSEPSRLIDVPLDAGYYDQAHMNADFRDFADLSPTEFLAARYAEGSGNTAREPA